MGSNEEGAVERLVFQPHGGKLELERKCEIGRAERNRVKLKIDTVAHTSDFISKCSFCTLDPLLYSYLTLFVPQILVFSCFVFLYLTLKG